MKLDHGAPIFEPFNHYDVGDEPFSSAAFRRFAANHVRPGLLRPRTPTSPAPKLWLLAIISGPLRRFSRRMPTLTMGIPRVRFLICFFDSRADSLLYRSYPLGGNHERGGDWRIAFGRYFLGRLALGGHRHYGLPQCRGLPNAKHFVMIKKFLKVSTLPRSLQGPTISKILKNFRTHWHLACASDFSDCGSSLTKGVSRSDYQCCRLRDDY